MEKHAAAAAFDCDFGADSYGDVFYLFVPAGGFDSEKHGGDGAVHESIRAVRDGASDLSGAEGIGCVSEEESGV